MWAIQNWGPVLIALGAALFAFTNATSTALYRRGGTVVTMCLIRCVVVYLANGFVMAFCVGKDAAVNVMLLRGGQRVSSMAALLRGLLGSVQALGLNVSLMFLTLADALTIFKGVDCASTVLIARVYLDSGEQLSRLELACGALTLAGIILIAQPPLLFGASAPHVNALALAAVVVAGTLSASHSVVTRLLSKVGNAHYLSPSMLLSHKLVVTFGLFALFALVGKLTGLADTPEFGWMQCRAPADVESWCILCIHCAFTMGAELALAAGYATTRAGLGGFLLLTELAWAYTIDICILTEPTNLFASLGTALILVSALAVLQVSAASSSAKDGSSPPSLIVGLRLREGLLPLAPRVKAEGMHKFSSFLCLDLGCERS
jgi:drug/metabolite transporter (DMT)-like permease